MQYLLSVIIDENAPIPPDVDFDTVVKDVMALNEEMVAKGTLIFGEGLHPSSSATVVRPQNGEAITTDGPYAETKEVLGGIWIIKAADLDEALDWASRATLACQAPVEVRPFQDSPKTYEEYLQSEWRDSMKSLSTNPAAQ